MDGDTAQRVVAAVEHARMLLYRGASVEEVASELAKLTRLVPDHSAEADFATAVEMLAQAPAEDVERWAAAVEQQRRGRNVA